MSNADQASSGTHPELEQFVFGKDPFSLEKIPRGLSAEVVAEFVTQRIDAEVELESLRRVEKLIDFYDAYEAAEHLIFLLEYTPAAPAAALHPTVAARIIAKSGTTQGRALAAEHYLRLAPQANTVAALQELIGLYAELSTDADAAPIRDRVSFKIQELRAEPESAPTRLEILDLKEQVSLALARAEQAAEIKRKILDMKDRSARIAEEIKMYLTIKYGYLEYLQPWAARRLRREEWGEHPAEQETRVDNSSLRKEIAVVFRKAVSSLDSAPTLSPEEAKYMRIRALRAVEFFGGELSPEELVFLATSGGEQMDTLSNR